MSLNFDVLLAMVFAGTSLTLYVHTLGFPEVPAFFPQRILMFIFALSVVWAVGSWRKKEGTPVSFSIKPVIIFALSAAYVALIPKLGYVVSTLIYTSVSMAVLGVRRITVLAAVSVGAALVVFALFAYVLGVPLPRFPLTF
jgi:hypothetical protein